MKICVVDDSSVVRSIVKQGLEMYGYTDIMEAVDGVEALEMIKPVVEDIKLYILDINMPNMDGLTLIGEIRKLNKTAPIIMLTTETDKAKMVIAKEKGATGWIIKPFETEKFMNIVNMFFGRG